MTWLALDGRKRLQQWRRDEDAASEAEADPNDDDAETSGVRQRNEDEADDDTPSPLAS